MPRTPRTIAVFASLMLSLTAVAAMTPGMYEYAVKTNMSGTTANTPAPTFQRCLGAKDVEGNKAFEMPSNPGSDCKINDLAQSGGKFSYKMSCTKPQKMDTAVRGTVTTTGMTLDMTMTMKGMSAPMTQTITIKRIGDCKP